MAKKTKHHHPSYFEKFPSLPLSKAFKEHAEVEEYIEKVLSTKSDDESFLRGEAEGRMISLCPAFPNLKGLTCKDLEGVLTRDDLLNIAAGYRKRKDIPKVHISKIEKVKYLVDYLRKCRVYSWEDLEEIAEDLGRRIEKRLKEEHEGKTWWRPSIRIVSTPIGGLAWATLLARALQLSKRSIFMSQPTTSDLYSRELYARFRHLFSLVNDEKDDTPPSHFGARADNFLKNLLATHPQPIQTSHPYVRNRRKCSNPKDWNPETYKEGKMDIQSFRKLTEGASFLSKQTTINAFRQYVAFKYFQACLLTGYRRRYPKAGVPSEFNLSLNDRYETVLRIAQDFDKEPDQKEVNKLVESADETGDSLDSYLAEIYAKQGGRDSRRHFEDIANIDKHDKLFAVLLGTLRNEIVESFSKEAHDASMVHDWLGSRQVLRPEDEVLIADDIVESGSQLEMVFGRLEQHGVSQKKIHMVYPVVRLQSIPEGRFRPENMFYHQEEARINDYDELDWENPNVIFGVRFPWGSPDGNNSFLLNKIYEDKELSAIYGNRSNLGTVIRKRYRARRRNVEIESS